MTKKQQIDWLCRLRFGLVTVEMPKEWRVKFDEALSDAIEELKYRTKVKCIVMDGKEFEIEQKKVGRWIESNGVGMFVCSVCNDSFYPMPTCMGKPLMKYCPNCGSRMMEVEE